MAYSVTVGKKRQFFTSHLSLPFLTLHNCPAIITGMETMLQPKELARIFRENMRARRMELGITQHELAKRLKVTQPFVAQLESGSRLPSLELLAKIADALQTTPDALLTPNIFSSIPS